MQRLVALRLIDELGLQDLMIVNRPISGYTQDFCFAVKDGDSDTLSMLNEGLALVVADGTRRRLYSKWFAALELPSDRPIVIGGDDNYPPFEFLDEKGNPAGYNVDLVRAVAQAVGMDIEIRLGPWANIVKEFEKGEIDAIEGMSYSLDRDANVDFSPPHNINHRVSVVRRGNGRPPCNLAELRDLSIIVQDGDILHEWVVAQGLTNRLTVVRDQEDALREVAAGRQDCALVARMSALYWIDKFKLRNLVVGDVPLLASQYCFAVQNGGKALLANLSEGLKAIEQSGEYRRIHDKWMGVYEESSTSLLDLLGYVAVVAIPLLGILAMVFLWSWSLQRKVSERTAALRVSEARLHRAQRVALIGDWELDLSTGMVDASEEARCIYGFDNRLWGIKEVQEIPLPEYRAMLNSALTGLCERGEAYDVTFRIQRPSDGALVDVYSVAKYDRDRNLVYGVIQDVTDQKANEALLAASEEQLRLVLDSSPIPTAVVDPENVNIFSWSRSACELFGHTPATTAEWFEIAYPDPDYRREVLERWKPLLAKGRDEGGTVCAGEYRICCQDGSTRVCEIFVRFVPGNLIVTLHDITEQNRLQESLLQAQKLESVGRLAGGVAHDFNNLLTGIMNYVDLCRDNLDADHTVRQWLDEITRDSQRSAGLVRQLLTFARKQTIKPKVLDLNDAVADTLNLLRHLIGADVNLLWQPGASLEPVKMDPTQLDQILANLCVNARDAIAGVGKITIETINATINDEYCAEHAEARPGDFIVLAVSDDGCGMDAKTLVSIFEPFFTTKGVGKGTGLGLATLYGIVKQNDGFINVYSEPGVGTTFRIYLPVSEEGVRAPAVTKVATPRPRGNETILLVEDENSIRLTTAMFLSDLGYEMLSAESPEEAVDLVAGRDGEIDLLITDVVMPGMSGRDLAVKLEETRPNMRCLYVSGYTANVIADRGIFDSDVNFLPKPFSRDDIAKKVREILDSR